MQTINRVGSSTQFAHSRPSYRKPPEGEGFHPSQAETLSTSPPNSRRCAHARRLSSAHTSLRLSAARPFACSGLMYEAVPRMTPILVIAGEVIVGDAVTSSARPTLVPALSPIRTSSTFTAPSGRSWMFAGLRLARTRGTKSLHGGQRAGRNGRAAGQTDSARRTCARRPSATTRGRCHSAFDAWPPVGDAASSQPRPDGLRLVGAIAKHAVGRHRGRLVRPEKAGAHREK